MKHKKELMLILVLSIFIALFYSLSYIIPLVYAQDDWCYFPNLADKPCVAILADTEIKTVEDCTKAQGSIPYEAECTIGCCCLWKSVDKKYEQQTGTTKGYCNSLSSSVFNPSISSPALCTNYCNSLTSLSGDEGTLPACMNGVDDDNDGLTDYPIDEGCSAKEDDSEEATASEKECSDQIDNDGDGKIDYYGFYESTSQVPSPDKYKYYSDLLTAGTLPDTCCIKSFGMSEKCSFDECKVGGNNADETKEYKGLCQCGKDVCGFPEFINPLYETGKTYATGKYCCAGKCTSTPCGPCTEGETTYIIDNTGKTTYTCKNGVFEKGITEPIGAPEQCFGAEEDEDNNGAKNCEDTKCYTIKCSMDKGATKDATTGKVILPNGCGTTSSLSISYFDESDDFWKCCFPIDGKSRVNDCKYNDGVPDTCGACECLNLHKPAQNLKAQHVYGQAKLNLSFYFECQEPEVELKILRCDGTAGSCGVNSDGTITLETSTKFVDVSDNMECLLEQLDANGNPTKTDCFGDNGILQPGQPPQDISAIFDTKILPEKDYTYVLESIYPDKEISYSNAFSMKSGSKMCLSHSGHFCIRNNQDYLGSETKRYYCDENNKLQFENCQGNTEQWPEEVCMETEDEKGIATTCAPNTPCIFCGQPFNMYGSLGSDGSKLSVPEEYYEYKPASIEENCYLNSVCYYDSTKTIKDAYDSCKNIGSCSDYKSKKACTDTENQNINPNVNDITNKCLPYNCSWVAFESLDSSEIEAGICTDATQNYKTCDMCNKLTSKLFGGCNPETCKTNFNSDTTKCYFDQVKKSCVESSKITCSNYETEEDCHNSDGDAHSVELNVNYDKSGKRIWGDNIINQTSNDLLDFKICKWKDDTDACIRDANGDGKYDVAGEKAIDITPPQTEVIAPSNVGQIELKFSVNDPVFEGRPSSGELKTYYCFPSTDPLPKEIIDQYQNKDLLFKDGATEEDVNYCYPDTLFIPDAGAASKILSMESGQQTMFFYSEDGAHNLEPVKLFIFNIDNKPPVITIVPYITLDQSYPFEQSSVLLSVELDEKAVCYDIFEDYEGIKKINYESGNSFQAVYDNLEDGTYLYTVVCEDKLGNNINKTASVKIDADQEIQGSLPEGVIDYSPVNLEIKTTHKSPNDDCRIGTGDTFDVLSGFASKTPVDQFTKYSTPFSLSENKVYEFKVMCKFSGKLHKDEIQFVYDTTPPKTSLTDSAGNTFDISKWYNKQEASQSVYLKCNDEPEYGFGCKETKYCIESGSAKCNLNFDVSSETAEGTSYESYSAVKISPAPSPQWLCYQSKEDIYAGISSYGGSIEEKQCVKLLIDSNSGPTIDVPLLKPYTNLLSAYEYFTPLFVINGEVVDSDAEANPPPQNKLTIDVYPITEDYLKSLAQQDSQPSGQSQQAQTPSQLKATETFTIDANNQFSQELTLTSGLNKIVLSAVDRSGKTSGTYEYYIIVSAFDGNLFEVISPPKGVSDNKEFDLIIETTKDLPVAESCALSTNPKVGFTAQMEKLAGKKFKNHINFPSMAEETYYTVYVKCTFPGGVFDIKEIDLIWDKTPPSIEKIFIQPSDGKGNVVEPPLLTNLTVVTDDKSRCKLSTQPNSTYFTMSAFDKYDTQNLSYVNEQPLTDIVDSKNYTYYVKCDNGPTEPASTHISNEAKISFNVNLSVLTGMDLVKPDTYIGYTSVNFELHTSKKSSECTFGPTQELVGQYPLKTVTEGVDAYKVHKGGPLTLIEGQHDFFFTCLTAAEGWITNDFVFYVDLSPPIVQVKTQSYTNSLNTLTANWEAYDNNTEIKGYNYSIGTKQGIADIFEWSATDNEKKTIHSLNLNNETTYWWNVKAINSVGLVSAIASNSTYIDTTYDPGFEINITNVDTCKDDILDSDETDIDCGGSCQKCSNGKNCKSETDCIGNKCESGICISASCEDNILNQLETDIDCGGSCASCPEGMNCNINSDCSTGFCKSSFCTLPSCDDGVQNGQEQGIDCGGSCLNACEILESPEEEETCDDGIKNQGETGIDCGGSCKACEIPPETTEPSDEPSTWWIWLIVLLILSGIGGGGYYYYTTYFFKETYPKQQTQQRMPQRPLTPSQQQLQSTAQTKMQSLKPLGIRQTFNRFFKPLPKEFREKRSQEKLKQRTKIFGAFESPEEQKEKLAVKERLALKENLAEARTDMKKEETKPSPQLSTQKPTPQPKPAKLQLSEAFKDETDVTKEEIKEIKPQQKEETKKSSIQKEQTPKLKAKEFLKPKKKAIKQLTTSSSAIDKLSKLKKESAMSKLGKGRDAFKQLSKIAKKK